MKVLLGLIVNSCEVIKEVFNFLQWKEERGKTSIAPWVLRDKSCFFKKKIKKKIGLAFKSDFRSHLEFRYDGRKNINRNFSSSFRIVGLMFIFWLQNWIVIVFQMTV